MADKFYFSRDTEVYLIKDSSKWLIPVLDGFSFSQGTNTSEITLNEMADGSGNSRRSRQLFTDSYAPAEWSFQTYLRPFKATAGATNGWEGTGSDAHHHCVEEALWACFMGAASFTKTSGATEAVWSDTVTNSTSNVIFDFTGSEVPALATFDLFFEMGAASGSGETFYKLADCVVSSVSIDFDIDGIATATWSGNASMITDESALGSGTLISEGTTTTSNFIRNRLTQLSVTAADTTTFPGASSNGVYNLVLTGGNITMENNITYLTPETLGVVNQPLGHVTGTRSVTGNFTCYLNNETGGSADLFEDLIEATSVITNSFNTIFKIGGTNAPKVQIDLPKCHFEVPSHSIDDIISLETSFHALPASVDPSSADNFEAKVTYTGS
tara:strand:+ start:77 stop:1231 length:1155 start_codon:yes stop_codon:yes gene_type:complete